MTQNTFNITLSQARFECYPTKKYEFSIGSSPLSFSIGYFNFTDVIGVKLTQIMDPIGLDDNKSEIPLPSFIRFEKDTKKFTMQQAAYTDIGMQQIGLKLGYSELSD